jgi:uncharacterized RDD family membrane protein YckC
MSNTVEPSLQGQYAGFASRFCAFVVDVIILNGLVLMLVLGSGLLLSFLSINPLLPTAQVRLGWLTLSVSALLRNVGAIAFMLLFFAYPIFFWTLAGQTPGKALIGLRVVQMNGEPLHAGRAFGRALGYWLASLPFFLGFLWVLVDDQRRGWHDHLTNTCVIYAWEAREATRLQARLARRRRARASKTRDD